MQNQIIQELISIIDQKEHTVNTFQKLKFCMESTFKSSGRI